METRPTREQSKPAALTLKPGWFCYLLTAVIIAARAFQPNAQPMCDWSWWSWLLMCLPVFMPAVVLAAWFALYVALSAVAGVLELLSKILR